MRDPLVKFLTIQIKDASVTIFILWVFFTIPEQGLMHSLLATTCFVHFYFEVVINN